ncbi:HipA N-terminal domain-containing protein [Leeuwenhoekiella marinoflava]|uniref:Serine/threonine-protein kinase HipA n=2 Tax=Leeuwenhoekiella marinoflava TaxID=988 RepID=A0A4V1KQK1_9FLAO|nr:HipA N-terminal domain-containing protein [Leeuwenhoekiella marinoflava]RXG21692.1 serine/threonine-protein kinase HipA [Leeuwenhoekiella marinoflava]SHF75822.1 serine/threonine-protein kinase HipA [Leeuwenhoekiella marinoflava DSM 3653]
MRQGEIWVANQLAGVLTEDENGYHFKYQQEYLEKENVLPVSLTIPLQKDPFYSENLFPFFDGLIPEGWLLDITHKNWKINPRDRMGLLLATCRDCIGNISVRSK